MNGYRDGGSEYDGTDGGSMMNEEVAKPVASTPDRVTSSFKTVVDIVDYHTHKNQRAPIETITTETWEFVA